MSEWEIVLIAGCIVLTTFTVEGIAGFGATVMALPFVTMLVGIDKAVPMLSSLNIVNIGVLNCSVFSPFSVHYNCGVFFLFFFF